MRAIIDTEKKTIIILDPVKVSDLISEFKKLGIEDYELISKYDSDLIKLSESLNNPPGTWGTIIGGPSDLIHTYNNSKNIY